MANVRKLSKSVVKDYDESAPVLHRAVSISALKTATDRGGNGKLTHAARSVVEGSEPYAETTLGMGKRMDVLRSEVQKSGKRAVRDYVAMGEAPHHGNEGMSGRYAHKPVDAG